MYSYSYIEQPIEWSRQGVKKRMGGRGSDEERKEERDGERRKRMKKKEKERKEGRKGGKKGSGNHLTEK